MIGEEVTYQALQVKLRGGILHSPHRKRSWMGRYDIEHLLISDLPFPNLIRCNERAFGQRTYNKSSYYYCTNCRRPNLRIGPQLNGAQHAISSAFIGWDGRH